MNGDATLPCGSAPPACYSPLQYRYLSSSGSLLERVGLILQSSCTNNQLSTKPIYNGPFTVKASNPNAPFHGLEFNAAGRKFNLNGTTSSYCPDVVLQQGGVCPPGNRTVFYGGGMNVMVPGGQIYVSLKLEQAHLVRCWYSIAQEKRIALTDHPF